MLVEFEKEVLKIKKRIKITLKNVNDNTQEIINTTCIYKKNSYTYIDKDIKYILNIESDNKILLSRENKEFKHILIFSNKIEQTEYFLKEYNNSLEFRIKTNKINILENIIEIEYEILETNTKYIYIIEMSD